MSALKEKTIVREENGKLVFLKHPPNALLIAAAKSKPKELPPVGMREDAIHKQRPWGYKGTQSLAKNPKEPLPNVTPFEWTKVGIEHQGNKFRIVWLLSRNPIYGSDLKCARLDPELKTDGLTLAEALETGAVIDRAMWTLLGRLKNKSFFGLTRRQRTEKVAV